MSACKTIVVGMSGGVDSSVVAALLREEGHQVIGATMRIWDGRPFPVEGKKHGCYGPEELEDVEDARRVAQRLGIPFHEFDLAKEYREHVLEYFKKEYLRGRTPNPCVVCNRFVKFGFLVDRISASGLRFDAFATGHYAQVHHDDASGRWVLRKGADPKKDQSYFLGLLTQDQLGRVMFPLGHRSKAEVRYLAERFDLEVAQKRESQDFLGTTDYSILFDKKPAPGPIVDQKGKVLGRHDGIINYTVGQRRGLDVAAGERLHVVGIDPDRNAVVVGPREASMGRELTASELNWVSIDACKGPRRVNARVRLSHKEAPAELTPLDGGRVRIVFDEPQFAVTPGQTVVFYEDDTLLGAGVIDDR